MSFFSLKTCCRAIVCLAVAMPVAVPAASQTLRPFNLSDGLALSGPRDPKASGRPLGAFGFQQAHKDLQAATKPPDGVQLRRLPSTISGFRLNGENGSLQWPVYLTESQASSSATFDLVYRSAISVTPGSSMLTVTINDIVIGGSKIGGPEGTNSTKLDVPAGLLAHGFNAVRISIDQHHRVDCSLAATYELWTELDKALTGFSLQQMPPSRELGQVGDLAALLPRTDGSFPIRILTSGKMQPGAVDRIIMAAQDVALIGRFTQPVVEFESEAAKGSGLNLLIGTTAELSTQIDLSPFGAIAEPRLGLLQKDDGLQPTLVITGVNSADLDEALRQLGQLAALSLEGGIRSGTPAGIRVAVTSSGLKATGRGQHLLLQDVATSEAGFFGRSYRKSVLISMPPDFLPADYAKAVLDLDGAYGAGLTDEAQIAAKLNGRDAGSIKLPQKAGETFIHKQITLPLSLMRPGTNDLEIIAQVPTKLDESCMAVEAAQGQRLFRLDKAELILPEIARIARSPELSLAAAGGLPYLGSPKIARLYVPVPDRPSLSAALTFSTRLAVAAGNPMEFRFTQMRPDDDGGPVLLVAPARVLDLDMMRSVGLDPDLVKDIWETRLPVAPSAIDSRFLSETDSLSDSCRLPVIRDPSVDSGEKQEQVGAPNGENPARRAQSDLIEVAGRPIVGGAVWPANLGRLGIMRGLVALGLRTGMPPEAQPLNKQTSLIMAQGYPSQKNGDLWTIVTAPEAAVLQTAVGCLVSPAVWIQLRGGIAGVEASSGMVRSIDAEGVRFLPTQEFSVSNARLIAAGWLTLHPGTYILIALIIAVNLSLATLWFVRNVGRKQT
jgi:hypothetical protein